MDRKQKSFASFLQKRRVLLYFCGDFDLGKRKEDFDTDEHGQAWNGQ
jgi:hypothetical protein